MKKQSTGSERDARGRFVKGASPNPRGRPRKAAATPRTETEFVLERVIDVTTPDGRRRPMKVRKAIALRRIQDAMEGKARAIAQITKYMVARIRWFRKEADRKAELRRANETNAKSSHSCIYDSRNADTALVILNIATRDAEYERSVGVSGYMHLKLEPWAVQAALRRRRSPEALQSREIAEINRCSRDEEMIRWPKGSRD